MKAINPANNELIQEYIEHSSVQVQEIIATVDTAQKEWATTSFAFRSEKMHKLAIHLRNNVEKYAKLATIEMGKVINEARAEVEKCAWACDYYADNAQKQLADELIESDASRSFVSFEPLGLVLAVMPWNYPYWQVFRFAAPALMAGNGGLLKHASNVPACALAIEAMFREAGFPEDLFRTLLIPGAGVDQVLRDDRIKAATLTGSESAGVSVASISGSELKKNVLELGGSDAFIVLADADIDAAAKVGAASRMLNCGQSCIAAKRFIVVEEVLQEFEQKHTAAIAALKIGDPLDESTQVAPMARSDLADELDVQVQQSIKAGARVLLGGSKIEGPGAYYEPTVLTQVKKGMAVYDEETFGPVSAIIPVKDEEEAIHVANDSRFGLGGALWSRDIEKAERLARRVETGAIFINGFTKSDPRLPFGGIKKSGYGRELSHYGIKEFMNLKTIWIA